MCWKCGNSINIEEPVSRTSECPFCHADLHSCRNCHFYSAGSKYDCHETVEEPVYDKERANFCESFKLERFIKKSGASDNSARKAFDALFS